MKKILTFLAIIIALAIVVVSFIPKTTHAAVAWGWSATSTPPYIISPGIANGNYPGIFVPFVNATSTTRASVFPYASTTALSATSLCLLTDCRTAWPTGAVTSVTNTDNTLTISPTTGDVVAGINLGNYFEWSNTHEFVSSGGLENVYAVAILNQNTNGGNNTGSLLVTTASDAGNYAIQAWAATLTQKLFEINDALNHEIRGNLLALDSGMWNLGSTGNKFANLYASAISPGSVMYGTADGSIETDSSNFVWNSSTKRLGIGTTTPGQKISVAGDILANQIIGSYFTGTTTATSTLVGGLSTNLITVNSVTASSSFGNGINIANGCFSIAGNCISGSGSGTVGAGTTGQLPYYAGSGTVLTATSTIFIDTMTEVGIGSSTPFAKLGVQGLSNGTGRSFLVSNSVNAANFTVLDNGRVGIGTSTPANKLSLQTASHSSAAASDLSIINAVGVENVGFAVWNGGGGTSDSGSYGALVLSAPVDGQGDRFGEISGRDGNLVRQGDIIFQRGASASSGQIQIYGTLSGAFNLGVAVDENGRVGTRGVTAPTAGLHLSSGTSGASTAPLKFNTGTLMATPEAGAVEFLTDKWYGTITTGASREEFVLADIALTSGRVPYNTTNGRLTDTSLFTFTGSNLGIGTTTPYAPLSVVGQVVATNFTATSTTATSTFSGPIRVQSTGDRATIGNAVLVGGTVTVNNAAATASSYLILTHKTSGGTLGVVDYTVTNGSFTITSNNVLDTSTYTWMLLNP